jgi:hypothetical protein
VGLAIRLVKGAYVEPERVAHRYGAATDGAYRRLAQAAGARVSLATHDTPLRDALLDELGPMDVEMLLGVRPEDHADLRAQRGGAALRAVRTRLVPLLDAGAAHFAPPV